MLNNWHKKEKPFAGFAGFGGGSSGLLVYNSSPSTTYYDFGDEYVESTWTIASTGAVSSPANSIRDGAVSNWASWTGISGQTIGSQFARSVTFYTGSSVSVGGIEIWSGHGNTADPLAAKDVAFYYSTDTTDGSNGTWTVINPTGFTTATANRHSSASSYGGSRTSSVDGNHVVLTGNVQRSGYNQWDAGADVFVYNGGSTDGLGSGISPYGNMADKIYWNAVSLKGLRIDIRSKWDNGSYAAEKPHIAEVKLFRSNHGTYTSGIELESDPNCNCYIDPARSYSGSGTVLTDLSTAGYNFNWSSGGSSGTWGYSSSNGGTLTSSSATLRNGNGISRSNNSMSFGLWVKYQAGHTSGNGQGMIWCGNTEMNQHFFIRPGISNYPYGWHIGKDINGTDDWVVPHVDNQSAVQYTQSIGTSSWFFAVFRLHSAGLVEWSIDGKQFQSLFDSRNAITTAISSPFGIGCDPYNDNYSSHTYGPFFYYDGVIPYYYVKREWDRYKTRFGR